MAENQNRPLAAAYLLVGEDALKRATIMDRLRKRVSDQGDLAFNADSFKGSEAAGDAIVAACNTLPFMSSVRLVEVSEADKLPKDAVEPLIAYLKAPSDFCVLALEAEKLAKNTRLYKAVAALGKESIIDCAPPAAKDMRSWVRNAAVSHGVTFSDKAAQKLVELVGNDTVKLDSEIRKVSLAHTGRDAVREDEVEALVARTAEAKPWNFYDAVCDRDLARALTVLGKLDSASPYSLVAGLEGRMRELLCAYALMRRGQSAEVAAALKKPDWQVKNHLRWVRGFSGDELREGLCSLAETERAMKSGANPHDALVDWLLAFIPKRR